MIDTGPFDLSAVLVCDPDPRVVDLLAWILDADPRVFEVRFGVCGIEVGTKRLDQVGLKRYEIDGCCPPSSRLRSCRIGSGINQVDPVGKDAVSIRHLFDRSIQVMTGFDAGVTPPDSDVACRDPPIS